MGVLIIGKGSVEQKIKTEQEQRRITRREIDVLEGRSIGKGAMRGDFNICKKYDKALGDYSRFKSPQDREKIKKEYFNIQQEQRRRG